MLQNNAYKAARTFVDDALEGLLELEAGVVGHPLELGLEILADQLMEGFSEDVGLPDLARIPLKFLKEIVHHLLRLLLVAHDGGDLGLNVGADHVDGRGGGPHPHAVPPALLDDLRLFQRQLLQRGDDDAVAGGLDLLQRPATLSYSHLIWLSWVSRLKRSPSS